MKALFGLWSDFKVADINRVLKPHGVRLVLKKSKDWGKNVSVTAHPTVVQKRARKPVAPDPAAKVDAERMAGGFGAALDLTKAAVG
jgi:hypothetical protein